MGNGFCDYECLCVFFMLCWFLSISLVDAAHEGLPYARQVRHCP